MTEKILVGQVFIRHALLCVGLCVSCGLIYGSQHAISVLLAAIVYSVPHGWMALRYFARTPLPPRAWVRRLYRLEAQKLLFSMVLFALVFIYVSVAPVIFFISYVLHVLFGVYWWCVAGKEC